jgi:flagellar biosynthesis protein FlhG
MEKILSQEEIDALLRGIEAEKVNTTSAPTADPTGSSFDFVNRERIIRGHRPTPEVPNESFDPLLWSQQKKGSQSNTKPDSLELMRLKEMDQGERLRMEIEAHPREWDYSFKHGSKKGEDGFLRWPRVISVGSGKGGVGKTNVVANLAFAFTCLGKKVLVLDADLGLANIDVLLGLTPKYTIQHLLNGQKDVFEILTKGPGGMSILPASSGVLELVDLNESQKILLLSELDQVAETVDILFIDTGAGISSNVLYFNMTAGESIVVVTPEPTSITDAYALMKVLSTKYKKERFTILINSAQNSQEAKAAFQKISTVIDRFLGSVAVDYLGFVFFDEKLPTAVKHQRPVLEMFPQAPSSRCFMEMAKTLIEKPVPKRLYGQIQFFWRYLFECQNFTQNNGGGR